MKMKYLASVLLFALGLVVTSCNDDEDYAIATGNIITTIETGEAAVTATTASLQGVVRDLSGLQSSAYQVGVIYGTQQDPTTSSSARKQSGQIDASTGSLTASITGLQKGETYYYATYVTLQGKVTKYGDVKQFTTTDAKIAASEAADITSVSAVLGGVASSPADVINVGTTEIEYGIKLAVSESNIEEGREFAVTSEATAFSQKITGLLPGKTYYYATYFKMGDGLVYSDVKSFTTATKDMEYVDLGLSVMWAKYNIGAESETEFGGLYGYGDVTGLKTAEFNSQYATTDLSATASDIVASISAAIDGAATMKSQTPTEAQVQELLANTTQEFAEVEGVTGYRFTAKNGNSIFLPAAGWRVGEAVTGEGVQGLYCIGAVNAINSDYANTLSFTSAGVKTGVSPRYTGLALRSVRAYEPVQELSVDNSKLVVGDLEGNGRIRIEIFNLYGATSANAPVNPQLIKFSKNMIVTFRLSGVSGNLKEGAAGTYYGGLEYADDSWDPSLWSNFDSKYDCAVTGDGTYTVWMETGGNTAEGAAVFCIDINGLGADLVDINNVSAEIVSIQFDVEDSQMQYYVDNSKVLFNNKDGNGTDGRIEIFNEYGDTKGMGVDVSDLAFSGYLIVNFSISGIDGNLVDGADQAYKAELSYATPSWWPSYWGGIDFAAATVTGDGTYTVFAPIDGNTCQGAVVWTIELIGLWKDLVDTSKVQVTINNVIIPGKN